MPHSILSYLRLKIAVSFLRLALSFSSFLNSFSRLPPSKPNATYSFKSRDKKRDVLVDIYRSKFTTNPVPVLLNWHGSGFVLPLHRTDSLFCKRVADETDFTVLDASYALAPEHPFPAALEDVEDLILQVFDKSDEYDLKNVVLAGFSAGANLALVSASNPSSTVPRDQILAILAFYPPCDLSVSPFDKRTPDGSMGSIPAVGAQLFNSSYVPPGVDFKDPRISPLHADPASFPENILFITCGKDDLAPEAEELAKKLETKGKKVTLKRIEGAEHAWDKEVKENTALAKERDEAYGLAIKILKEIRVMTD